jgi:hypothetical protein
MEILVLLRKKNTSEDEDAKILFLWAWGKRKMWGESIFVNKSDGLDQDSLKHDLLMHDLNFDKV